MTMTLAQLSERSGQHVLDHLERAAAVPVIDAPQAQGDLLIVPHHPVADDVQLSDTEWIAVPPEGIELLRSTTGGNPHTLVADPGTCHWASGGVRDRTQLALGALRTTGPAYLIHAEHGGTGIAPGTYVVRRQREGTGVLGYGERRGRRHVLDTFGGVHTRVVAD